MSVVRSDTREVVRVATLEAGGSFPLGDALPPGAAQFAGSAGAQAFFLDPRWLAIFRDALRHVPYLLVAETAGTVTGLLPLALIDSWLFGRFLVSLPYLNQGGVVARDTASGRALLDAAVRLADRLDVRSLQLRHLRPSEHPSLTASLTHKVLMQLPLPGSTQQLWAQLRSKVRNQVRKSQSHGFSVDWGGAPLLEDFYAVFSQNMRDLGTPVFGRALFRSVLDQFPREAELCVVRDGRRPIAAALLVHAPGVTDVPSASSLRAYNPTSSNMLMYWHLLCRAVERGQGTFDFGRSSVDSNTFRFKKQWGAVAVPTVWQSYVRRGSADELRLEGGRYRRLVNIWKRLPVGLTRLLGPAIVRGIP